MADNYLNYLKRLDKLNKENSFFSETALSSNLEHLTNIVVNMFTYTDMFDGFLKKTLEEALTICGMAMITKNKKGDLIALPAHPAELPNDNGEFDTFIGETENGKVFKRKRGKDCVIIYNNSLHTPDRDVYRYADMLTEVDKSAVLNLIYSRYLPIPLAKNNKSLVAIDKALNDLKDGKIKTILDENLTIDDILGSDEAIKTISISDVENADKLQAISRFYDDILRRFCQQYGHDMNSTPKAAQQSIKEITGAESYSWIYPVDKLTERIEGIERMNELYGTSASVAFSTPWSIQYEAYILQNEEPEVEPTKEPNEAPEDEPKEEPAPEKKEE